MIRSLTFTPEAAASVVPWWGKCPAWRDRTSFTFNPGLTLICGPNGTGKTALFKMLARLLLAEQGGKTAITEDCLGDTRNYKLGDIQLDHDGQGVWHLDLTHTPGLVGGMAAFDFAFMEEAMLGVETHRSSAGQGTLMRLGGMVKAMTEARAPEVQNQLRGEVPERIRTMLAGSGEKGPPTFLLDEPDRNLDSVNQVALWTGLRRLSKQCQIIVISHNILPLIALPKAQILETTPGYVDRARSAMEGYLE